MANPTHIQVSEALERAVGILNELPEDEHEIAYLLNVAGVKGTKKVSTDCPLLNYVKPLADFPEGAWVEVLGDLIAASQGIDGKIVTLAFLPEAAQDFVESFDAGHYVDLESPE